MRACPTLYVERLDGTIRYRLELPEPDRGPLQQQFVHAIDARTFAALCDGAEALLRGGEHEGFGSLACQRGTVLYRALIPVELRAPLMALDGPLLVATALPGVPWELLHDGERFWGVRYALGRRILLDRPVPAIAPAPPVGRRLRALVIGANPYDDLPFVGEEVERLAETFDRVAELVVIGGPLATFDAVTGALGQGFDLVHFCGHVVRGGSAGPALVLGDDQQLTARTIETILTGHPIVVLNGCASVRGGSSPDASIEPGVSSLAHGFLFGGALAVVGTLAEVADRRAAPLAAAFYRHVLRGATVGEALRRARQDLLAERPDSPAALSFVLFGNPTQPLVAPAVAPRTPLVTRRRVLVAVGGLGALAVAGLLVRIGATPPEVAAPGAPVVVGVMAVQLRGDRPPAWMAEVTRNALNTMLSKVDAVHVYSRQKIDFLRDKEGLREIEAAERLRMSTMLSTTIDLVMDQVVLEVEIVDIATGMLVATEQVSGPPARLIELQNRLAERILPHLGVRLTPEARAALLADRTDEMLEGYRRLAETLGPSEPTAPATPVTPPPPGSWFRWPARAWADDGGDDAGVRAALERFRVALEAEDVDVLAEALGGLSAAQRTAYDAYFANADELAVELGRIDVVIAGDDALATFTRRDVFVDVATRREMRLEVRLTCVLVKRDGRWRITALRKPS